MNAVQKAERLLSLDLFRGITIAGMILVNNPGSWSHVYPQLRHAEWNGVTFTDLIFPFFLFIIGVAMTFSMTKQIEAGANRKDLLLKILRRTLIIFALGIFLSGFPKFDLSTLRIPGVLQRIALCYLFTSIIVLRTGWKGQAYWTAGLLLFYWTVMNFVPVPGYGAGVLTPEGNFAAFIDGKLLSGHMWSQTKTWDPEGFLSTIPAIATTLTGVLTGWFLRSDKTKIEKTVWMLLIGNLGLFLGWTFDTWFPMNKSIWTSSYVIYTSGFALIFLAFCYWTVEVMNWRKWTRPFVLYGVNSIAVFVLSGFVARLTFVIKFTNADGSSTSLQKVLYNALFTSWLPPMTASLAWAGSYILTFLLLMWLMDKKGIYIKV
ncbi:MAG: DUF5009 domain-containing protein [Candidatus Marinimicrobia bacterium]|nr:DUF5009 domain-containing protein [Candidatus Neomarinimicrobiota bacterium]